MPRTRQHPHALAFVEGRQLDGGGAAPGAKAGAWMCPRCRVPRCCGPAAPARTLCRVPPPPSADGGGGGGRLSPTVAALGGPPAVDASLLETEAAHQRWLAALPPAAAADGLVGAEVTSREVVAFVAATPALAALLEHQLTEILYAVATGGQDGDEGGGGDADSTV